MPVYGTVGFQGWTQGLQRTLGGVGISRQRLPVEKECWCPAGLILAGRKEKMWKARERGRRRKDGKGRSQGLGRNGKGCLRKILFPFTSFPLTFTCFLSMALGCSLFAGGPTGLCSVIEAFGVNETAGLFERLKSFLDQLFSVCMAQCSLVFLVLRGVSNAIFTLKGHLY